MHSPCRIELPPPPSEAPDPLPAWKRAIDLACCVAALPVFAAACVLLWLVLGTTSPGPLFFRQERVGYKGRRFRIYKFRTMHVGADSSAHRAHVAALMREKTPMQKMDATRDSRLIPGAWLFRSTGLDELPQIINVALGDMSIVGPRPCIPYEYEQYSEDQRARFGAVPGLTGLWQVSGKNRTTFEEMVRFDIAYSRTKSLLLDFKIIILTVPALWTQVHDTRKARHTELPVTTRGSSVSASASATFQL